MVRRMLTRGALALVVICCTGGSVALAGQATSRASGPDLSLVPKAAQPSYAGYDYLATGMKLGPNPYAGWTPPKPPWKMCYSDTFQGNSWRQLGMQEFVKLANQLKAKGMVSGVVTTNSNLNTNVQISQFNSLVQQGCNVIVVIVPSPTGLCSAVENAFQKGVLVISAEQSMACPHGVAVQDNEYLNGVNVAKWFVKSLNGKGNIVMLEGEPSYPATQARVAGAKSVFAKAPGVKILGEITMHWNSSIAKTKMLQFIATHPQKIDGVWQEGCCGDVSSSEALKQSGRPPALINGWGGDQAWIAYWTQNKLNSVSMIQGGPSEIASVFEVALRVLMGQKAAVNNLIHPVPLVTNANVKAWAKASWTPKSTGFAVPANGAAVPSSYWSPFFKGGKSIPKLKY